VAPKFQLQEPLMRASKQSAWLDARLITYATENGLYRVHPGELEVDVTLGASELHYLRLPRARQTWLWNRHRR